jgi:hypothetical protein
MKGSPVRVRASALKALLRGHFWELLSTFTRNEKGSGWEPAPTFYLSCRDFRHLALVRLCPATSKRPPSRSLESAPSNASVRLSLSDGRPGTDGWASWRGGRGGVLRPLPPGPCGAPRVEGRVSCRPGPAGLGATTASLPSSALIQKVPVGPTDREITSLRPIAIARAAASRARRIRAAIPTPLGSSALEALDDPTRRFRPVHPPRAPVRWTPSQGKKTHCPERLTRDDE